MALSRYDSYEYDAEYVLLDTISSELFVIQISRIDHASLKMRVWGNNYYTMKVFYMPHWRSDAPLDINFGKYILLGEL